jgi:hypothetical protein
MLVVVVVGGNLPTKAPNVVVRCPALPLSFLDIPGSKLIKLLINEDMSYLKNIN